MKYNTFQWIRKHKWPLFFLFNMAPFALDITMYPLGAPLDFALFPPVFAGLTILNYHFFDKTLHYVMIQFYLLICMACSGCISTYLYYCNISNDPMTPAIGSLMVIWGSAVVVVTTAITGFIKSRKNKRKT